MAKVSYKMPEEFLLKVSRLADKTDVILPAVLEAGGQVALEKVRTNLQSVLSGKSTGDLDRALGLSPPALDRKGVYNVKVGFHEPRPDGSSNAKIANILEYGRSGHGQKPRPFLAPAKRQARKPVVEAMTRKLEEEIEGI